MASQQFCLKWNNHTTNMLNIFESLLASEALVDVTLACEGLSLKAHKVVLSACSPFFQDLFLNNPCKHPIVIMKDTHFKDLKTIVNFMYRGEVNVSQDQLSALLKTAEALKVKGLAEMSGDQSSDVPKDMPASVPSTPQQPSSLREDDSNFGSLHSRRKRPRRRKRSSNDESRGQEDSEASGIEEISQDIPMRESSIRSRNSSVQYSSASHRPSDSSYVENQAIVENPPSEEEFDPEPSKLLEQTFSTERIPTSAASSTPSHFNLPSLSGVEISRVGSNQSTSQMIVPEPVSDNSSHFQEFEIVDSPPDIKPNLLDESLVSPVPGTSDSLVPFDQSSMPGTSGFQDQSLDSPSQVEPMKKCLTQNLQEERGKKYQCEECRYSTNYIGNLKQHQRIHTGEKPFTCDLCDYRCSRKDNLKIHMRCHSFDKPFACSVCDYRCSRKDNLKIHIRSHTGEKPYKCRFCPSAFTQSSSHKLHESKHLYPIIM